MILVYLDLLNVDAGTELLSDCANVLILSWRISEYINVFLKPFS